MVRRTIAGLVGCALAVAAGASASLAHESSTARSGSSYTLMQMNLCLSGFAGCYGRVAYPAGVMEAVARIRAARPDAVTLNETCRRDVAQIARRTGYHLRFSTVTVAGEPLRCVRPHSRGHFGDAVLTKAAIVRSANDAQCAELAALLARRAATRTVVFGGDVNRSRACAPERAWSRTDGTADQAPGLQGVYGYGALRSPSAQVIPATHTDHDVLLVRAEGDLGE